MRLDADAARRSHSRRAIVPTGREPAMPMATRRSRALAIPGECYATNAIVSSPARVELLTDALIEELLSQA
jgi:hypothetical protein